MEQGGTDGARALRELRPAVAATVARARRLSRRAAAAGARAERMHAEVTRAQSRRQAALELMVRRRKEPMERLVAQHRPLAQRLAAHYASRGQPLEDLEQVAYIGLLTAARRFDHSRGVQFSTFARATINGELKKYFRDHAWTVHVPRPVQETYLAVRAGFEPLTQRLGRAPTPEELAADLGMCVEDVVEALEAANALHLESLDRPAGDDADWQPHERGAEDERFLRVEERSWLVPALAALPERERTIIRLRFFEGLPQSAIAARVGISQMHVSRLLARFLAELRSSAPPS